MDGEAIGPLHDYLDRTGEGWMEFAARAQVSYTQLWKIKHRHAKEPRASTLDKIEQATGGQVTSRKILDWLRSGA